MIETVAALLFAHVLADFVFQTNWMVAQKDRLGVLGLHVLVVGLASWICLGFTAPLLIVAIAWIHLAVDATKLALFPTGIGSYLADQTAHVATILLLVPLSPLGWADGIWAARLPEAAPAALAVLTGAIFATRAGGFAVLELITPVLARDHALRRQLGQGGLQGGGALIGTMERGLTFALILAGYPAGIAVLVAGKSLLRFSDAQKSRKLAEYVIIGTFASVGWAVITALGTAYLLGHLRP